MLQEDFPELKIHEFIYKMDLAYALADLVVARAGAITVSELSLVKKPAILVPFPYASEDHQTKNAMALVSKHAAIHIADHNAITDLIPTILDLMSSSEKRMEIQENLAKLSLRNSSEKIANEVLELVNNEAKS